MGSRVTQNCYHCGKAGHTASKCRISADIVCDTGGETGHMRKACRSTKRRAQQQSERGGKKKANLREKLVKLHEP